MVYARGAIFTGFIGRARQWVPSRFGIPEQGPQLWLKLLPPGYWKMVDLNMLILMWRYVVSAMCFDCFYLLLQNRTYNKKKPFGSEGIAHLLRLEIFVTKGGSNIDVFRELVAAKQITAPTIALMLTCVCVSPVFPSLL